MIQKQRITLLNQNQFQNGRYILYWMQQSQRTDGNHALAYAAQLANERKLPLLVFFGITPDFPEANRRHYSFMLQGLPDIKNSLLNMGIQMVVRICRLPKEVIELANQACAVIVDAGYLRVQRQWRVQLAEKTNRPVIQVESDIVVPVRETSNKEESGARTIRPKILKQLASYLIPVHIPSIRKDSLGIKKETFDISDPVRILNAIPIDNSVREVTWIKGGQTAALNTLRSFISERLNGFAELRNDPSLNHLSNLSPYLHFGQISPVHVALKVMKTNSPDRDAFIEEMVVKRELSMNFVFYNKNYDSFSSVPAWARATLQKHLSDKRPNIYSLEELESGATYDTYWNAAQREMIHLGKMHGYMRMYWAKKILEWSPTPLEAYRRALYLNNKYFLDGRDPNGYTGVAWCFGKHDRAWGERSVFGKVRYMNQKGLKRKFDMDRYVELVNDRIREEQGKL